MGAAAGATGQEGQQAQQGAAAAQGAAEGGAGGQAGAEGQGATQITGPLAGTQGEKPTSLLHTVGQTKDPNAVGADGMPAWLHKKFQVVGADGKLDATGSAQKAVEGYDWAMKKLGGFTGAPRDDKGNIAYKVEVPKDYAGIVTLNKDDDFFKGVLEDLGAADASQETLDKLITRYVSTHAPSVLGEYAEARDALGESADALLTAIAQWGTANLDPASQKILADGIQTAPNVKAIQMLIETFTGGKMPTSGGTGVAPGIAGKSREDVQKQVNDPKYWLQTSEGEEYRKRVDAEITAWHRMHPEAV